MKIAREVGDATGLPIMLHWTVEPDLLALLKRGDILAHPFNPPSPNSSNLFGGDTQADKVLPQILALKDRGIWTDGQLATTHHSWEISEKAVKLGWFPDAISTDISRAPDGSPASVLVPMTEFLHLGMPLEKVIAGVTSTPAKIFNFPEKVGTLEPGIDRGRGGPRTAAGQLRVRRSGAGIADVEAAVRGDGHDQGRYLPEGRAAACRPRRRTGRATGGPGGRGATPTAAPARTVGIGLGIRNLEFALSSQQHSKFQIPNS